MKPLSRWWTVFAGAIGAGAGAGIFMLYIFTVFAGSMLQEFEWSRSAVSLCITTFLVGAGPGQLALGYAIHKWNVKAPTAAFLVAFTVSVLVVAYAPPAPLLVFGAFFVMGVAGQAATAMPYSVAITGLFDRERGLALGLAVFGGGLGGLIGPHLANFLEQSFGWRHGMALVGLLFGGLGLVGVLFLTRNPPLARSELTGEKGKDAGVVALFLSRRDFWIIAAAILVVSVATFGVMGSAMLMLSDRGLTQAAAAGAVSMAGLGSLIGRVGVGALLDRFFAPWVTAGVLCFAAAGVMLIAYSPHTLGVILGIIAVGLALGAEADILTYLVGRYFHPAAFSRAIAALWVVWAWSGGIGTYLVGKSFDETGSYDPALWLFALLLAGGGAAICLLKAYPYPPKHAAEGAPVRAASGAAGDAVGSKGG